MQYIKNKCTCKYIVQGALPCQTRNISTLCYQHEIYKTAAEISIHIQPVWKNMYSRSVGELEKTTDVFVLALLVYAIPRCFF